MPAMPNDLLTIMREQRGLADSRQFEEAGVHHATVGRWTHQRILMRILPRVYGLAGAPLDWRRRGLALLMSLGQPSWLSHTSAAALHALRGTNQVLPVEATVPYGRSVRLDGTPWVRVHRTRVYKGDGADRIDGLLVASVERTLLDIASVGAVGWSADTVADALRRNLTTFTALSDTAASAGRVPGRRRLARIVAALDPDIVRAASQPEWEIRSAIVSAGLPPPVLNHEIMGHDGQRFEIDLAWPRYRLGFEYDSDEHHSTPSELRRDRLRHRRIAQLGWDLRHLSSSDRRRPQHVVKEVGDALRLHGWSPAEYS